MVREVRQPSLAATPSSSSLAPKSRSSSTKSALARPALTERTRHNNSTVSPVATRGALVADPPKHQQQARVTDVVEPSAATTTSSSVSATPRTIPRRLTALAAMASPAGTRRKGARSLRGPDVTTTTFGRAADNTTMLMDVAPPSDLASSSLFGDDDDDDDDDLDLPGPSTRVATNPIARSNGRGVRGSGGLLTPQNSQQVAMSQSQRGTQAQASALRPPPSPHSSQIIPSKPPASDARRSSKNARGHDTVMEYDTPLRDDDDGSRKKSRLNGPPSSTRLTQSQQASGSRARRPSTSTPIDTRTRTVSRTPATVHAASQRLRDATPMNRRSVTPMSITPSRRMLKQTREWRASLEPQLASRIPDTMYVGRLDEAIQPEPGVDPLMLLEDDAYLEPSRSRSASTAKKARTTSSQKGKQRALPDVGELDAEDTFAAHKARKDNSKAAATARHHLVPAAEANNADGDEEDAPANPDSPFVPQRLRSPLPVEAEIPLSRLRRFLGTQDTPSTRSDATRTVPSSPPREASAQPSENGAYPEFDPMEFAPDMPSSDGMSMELEIAAAVANAPSSPPPADPEFSLRRMAASLTPPYRAGAHASPTPTSRRATLVPSPLANAAAGPSHARSPSPAQRGVEHSSITSSPARHRLDSVEIPTPHRSLVLNGRRGPSDDEAAAQRASQRSSLFAAHEASREPREASPSKCRSATPAAEPAAATTAIVEDDRASVVEEEVLDAEGDTLVLAELSDDEVPLAGAETEPAAQLTPKARTEDDDAQLEDIDPEGDTMVLDDDEEMDMEMTLPVAPVLRSSPPPAPALQHSFPPAIPYAQVSSPPPSEPAQSSPPPLGRADAAPSRSPSLTPVPLDAVASSSPVLAREATPIAAAAPSSPASPPLRERSVSAALGLDAPSPTMVRATVAANVALVSSPLREQSTYATASRSDATAVPRPPDEQLAPVVHESPSSPAAPPADEDLDDTPASDAEDEAEAALLIPAVQRPASAVAETSEEDLDEGAETASDKDQDESDKDESDKDESDKDEAVSAVDRNDERDAPTRSPFADVVKAALGAGMVIDPGLAQNEDTQQTEHVPNGDARDEQQTEQQAPSIPASKEPSPEPKIEPEMDAVPPRRRRRMFAGSTPARPRTSGASQASLIEDEPPSPSKSTSQLDASLASTQEPEPAHQLRRSARTSVSGPSRAPPSAVLESPVRRSPRLSKSALATTVRTASPLATSARLESTSPVKRGRGRKSLSEAVEQEVAAESTPSPARILSFNDEPETAAAQGPSRTTTPLMSPPTMKTALAPPSPIPATAVAPTSSPAAEPGSSVRDRTPRSMDHESSRSSPFSPTTPPDASLHEKGATEAAHQSFTAFAVEVPEVAAKSLLDVAPAKMPPSPRSLERTVSAEGAAAETTDDIGANDTMDVDADDDAWDVTAANITVDGGEDTFAAHRFVGADWDVTRIERGGQPLQRRGSRSVSEHTTPPPSVHDSVNSTPMSRISSAPPNSSPGAHGTPARRASGSVNVTPVPLVHSTTPSRTPSYTPSYTPRVAQPIFSTTPGYAPPAPPRSPLIRVTPAPEDDAEETVTAQAPSSPSAPAAAEIDDSLDADEDQDEDEQETVPARHATHSRGPSVRASSSPAPSREASRRVSPSLQASPSMSTSPRAARSHDRVEFDFRADDPAMLILPLRHSGYFKREPEDEPSPVVQEEEACSQVDGHDDVSIHARSSTPRREAPVAPSAASPDAHLAVPSPAHRSRSASPAEPSTSTAPAAQRERSVPPAPERAASPIPVPESHVHNAPETNMPQPPAAPPPPPMPTSSYAAPQTARHSAPYRGRLGLPIDLGASSTSSAGPTPNTSRNLSHISELESVISRRRQQSTRPTVPSALSRQFVPSAEPSPQRCTEHVSAEDYYDENDDPAAFSNIVEVSSTNPQLALSTAEHLVKVYGYQEMGRHVEGTPGMHSTRGTSVRGTPYQGENSSYYNDADLSLQDMLYDERQSIAERNRRSMSVETRHTEYDSPLRIPGAYYMTPKPPRRVEREKGSRTWTSSDWRRLQRLYDAEIARSAGSWTPFKRGAAPLDAGRIVDAFVAQQQLEERELVGAFERGNLLTRVAALHRKAGHRKRAREERQVHGSTKRRRVAEAPPSAIKRVFDWILGRPAAQSLAVPTPASAARSPSPEPRHRDDDPESGFLRRVDDTFDIGEITMAQTPSRPVVPYPRREHTGRHRRSPSAPPMLESPERQPHPESPEPTQLEDTAYSYGVGSAPAAHAPLYPPLPERAAALTQSINPLRVVECSPRPAARVRSASASASASTLAPAPDPLDPLRRSRHAPSSVAAARGAWEAHAAMDLSFESARREREKSSLAGLRRVRSEIARVRSQGLDVSDDSFRSFASWNQDLNASVSGLSRSVSGPSTTN